MSATAPRGSGQIRDAALAKSSGFVFAGMILGRILNFAAQVLLSNMLGLAAFSAFTLGQSVLSFLTAFSQAGLHQATARFLAIGRAQQRPEIVRGVLRFAVPRVVLISAAFGLALVMLCEPLASVVFQKPEAARVLFWVGVVLPILSGLNWLGFALRGFRAVAAEAMLKEVAHPAVFLVLCLCAFKIGAPSLEAAWWAFFGSTIVALSYGGFRLLRLLHLTPRVAPARALGKEIRRFAIPVWFNRLFITLLNQSDRLMIGAFSAVAQIGLYHAAARIAAFQTMAMSSFMPMFSTAIAEAHAREDRTSIVRHYRMVVRWSIVVTLPICLTCLLFGRELLQLFGREFESAVPVLLLVTAASFVDAAVGPAGQFLQMIGRERAGLALVIAAALLSVGLNLILIPKFGATGAALGTGAGIVILNFGRLLTLRRFLGVFPYTGTTAKLLGVGLAAATLAWLATPLGILVKAGILFGVFIAGTLLYGLPREDREMLMQAKLKLRKKR